MEKDEIEIEIGRRRVQAWLGGAVVLLVVLSLVALFVSRVLGYEHALGFVPRFALDGEDTVANWFSALLLLSAGIANLLIAADERRSRGRFARHWRFLGFAFLALSLDEGASIHELLNTPLRRLLHVSGAFLYAWVIVGMAVVLAMGLAYIRFLIAMPAAQRRRIVLAGGLYVGGALGVELVGAAWHSAHGTRNLVYGLISTVEESLEMAGLVVFTGALVEEAGMRRIRLRTVFRAPAQPTSNPSR